MKKMWLIVCSLAFTLVGCAEVDSSTTLARVFGAGHQTLPDVTPPQDGATDGATDAPTDTMTDVVTSDVPGDQLGDVTVSDAVDASDASTDAVDVALSDASDASDVTPPTDTGADGGADVLDAADVADVQTDRVDVLLIDASDVTDVPVPTDTGVDVGSDTGLDVVDVPTDTPPIDTGLCPTGQTRCGTSCVNTQTDNANCGVCGMTCTTGQMCSGGVCGTICGAGLTACGLTCVNTQTSLTNCGACGIACTALANAAPACAVGFCGLGTCNTGFADCNATSGDGCEVDLRTTRTNCGACGRTCTFANAAATCAASACVLGACNTGFDNCDGSATNGCETDLRTTRTNCGACGRICSFANAVSTCAASACVLGTCNVGFGNCDGSATNGCEQSVIADPRNCGACGNVCASGVCEAGVCPPSPTIDVAFRNTSVAGVWVRSANYNAPNAVGDWIWQPCSASSPSRACRIDVRRLTVPGTSTSIATWANEWGLEIVAATSMSSPLCALTDASCSMCGGASFGSCLTATCVVGGLVPDGSPRYENAYGTVRPPGMGSGAFYAWRIGFLFPIRPLCPTAS